MADKANLISKIRETKSISWRELKFLQQETFKELSVSDRQKLKASLLANQFIQPFYVWEDTTGDIFCLDGKHRTLMLEELLTDGVDVPELLPATFINCEDRHDAAKMVLLFSSMYARITNDGLTYFMDLYNLSIDDIKFDVNLPDFDIEKTFGDLNRDFSSHNSELNIDELSADMIIKLTYNEADYNLVKGQLMKIASTPEKAVLKLLGHE
jgi:hypothetical protein